MPEPSQEVVAIVTRRRNNLCGIQMYIQHRTTSGNSFHPKIQEMYYLSGKNTNVFIAEACKQKERKTYI
jgi:hypothetical protein